MLVLIIKYSGQDLRVVSTCVCHTSALNRQIPILIHTISIGTFFTQCVFKKLHYSRSNKKNSDIKVKPLEVCLFLKRWKSAVSDLTKHAVTKDTRQPGLAHSP